VEPELAVALPAAGAACATALRPRPRLAFAAAAALGVAGVVAVLLSRPDLTSDQLGITLQLPAASRAMLIAAAAALAMLVALPPPRADRSNLLRWGLGGLAGMTAMAVAPTLEVTVMVLVVLVVLQAAGTGRRPYSARVRAPALAVALLGLAMALAAIQGPPVLTRIVVLCIVAGLAAALGVLPYIHQFEPDDLTATSPIAWLAFAGPLLAVVVIGRAGELVEGAEGAFGALLIGVGLLNIAVATIASWRTESDAHAWRYSFIADWGLALCGFGLVLPDGVGAALLVLYSILLGRLPLYLWSRQSLREKATTDRPINFIVAAALAGSAPFAGFPARILLLRAATALSWPLALVLALSFLLWLPGSLRLGRTMGAPTGRQLVGVAIALAVSVVFGLFPRPLLGLAGL
jgi:multicomponent Na+:H+ antiporter subunit D